MMNQALEDAIDRAGRDIGSQNLKTSLCAAN
jgi:hypothetical protein